MKSLRNAGAWALKDWGKEKKKERKENDTVKHVYKERNRKEKRKPLSGLCPGFLGQNS